MSRAAKLDRLLPICLLLAALARAAAQSSAPTAASVFELRQASIKPTAEWEARTVTRREETTSTLYLEKNVLLDQGIIKAAWVEHHEAGSPGQDRVSVHLALTAAGRQRFGEITQKLVGQQVAFIVDGQVLSAPRIVDPIRGGSIEISGGFTEEEAQKIAAKLNAAAVKTVTPVPPKDTVFSDAPGLPAAEAVAIPTGRGLFMTSGAPQPLPNVKSTANARERYGDTRGQAISALWQMEEKLERAGLGMKDVVYLRVHLLADPMQGGRFGFREWQSAYEQFFGTRGNPAKPPCSTVGVAGLTNPDWLIEIEAVAAYPAGASDANAQRKVENADNSKAARIQAILEAARAGGAAAGADTSDAAMKGAMQAGPKQADKIKQMADDETEPETPRREPPPGPEKPSATPDLRRRGRGVGFMR